MSVQDNKRIALRTANELVCERKLDLLEEIIHPDYRYRGPARLTAVGPGGYRSLLGALVAGFSDLATDVHTVTAEGDWVSMQFQVTAKNDGPLFGRPATGRVVTFGGIINCRIADGKVIEQAEMFDYAWLMQQLGVYEETAPHEFS